MASTREKPFGREAYYNSIKHDYFVTDSRGGWISVNESSLKRMLLQDGLSKGVAKGGGISAVDCRLNEIQLSFNVKYAGPLAGYDKGFYDFPDARVLVTESPQIIPSKPDGECPLLDGILIGLLGELQLRYFMGWLHFGRMALLAHTLFPGHAMAIAGPRNSGKSLIQKVITHCLGGRQSKPYLFMSGQTSFNSQMFVAEHLVIEDENPASDYKSRRTLGSMIKMVSVNEDQTCHEKGFAAIMLRPFWRLSITVNDEPENLMVLPIVDESLEDKIMLLKASKHQMPMPTRTPEQRKVFWAALEAEIPYFLHKVETFSVTEDIADDRMGVAFYHHPELLAKIADLSPEAKLLSIIDNHLLSSGVRWTGKAVDLEKALMDSSCTYSYEARKLFSFNTACGTYLGRLRQRYPERFEYKQIGDERERIWTIVPKKQQVVDGFKMFDKEEEY